MGYCPSCFLLPVLPSFPALALKNVSYKGFPKCKFTFGAAEDARTTELWAKAKDFMAVNPEDLFAFAKADPSHTEMLPPPANWMLRIILRLLLSEFLVRPKINKPYTRAERILLLQLHKKLEFDDIKKEVGETEAEKFGLHSPDVLQMWPKHSPDGQVTVARAPDVGNADDADNDEMPLWMRVLLDNFTKRDLDFLFTSLNHDYMQFMFDTGIIPKKREQHGKTEDKLQAINPASYSFLAM